ncbi:glycosyltransferase family 4 protein [Desertivirga brevis]|uniref:glycosyltransferase family 4 protein n=1 Tax=Desertivirga brevis TaxID=2810310 RepID=UPI001A9699ED|nr:glycosyltransferase family 1 protein [Pedobacter sp. SYSU D00873]
MIKIQFDHQHFSNQVFGGISRYFANIQAALSESDEFSFDRGIYFTKNYYLKDEKFPLPRIISRYMIKKYSDSRIYRKNTRYSLKCIQKNKYDLFHPTYYDPYFVDHVKVPVVLTVHDLIHEKFPLYFPLDDETTHQKRLTIERTNHFIAISESTKRDLQEYYQIPEDQITVIYHGYNPIDFSGRISKDYGNYILFVGDRTSYKNFLTFLQAVKEIVENYRDIEIICAGGEAFRSVEKEVIHRLGLSDRIRQFKVNDAELHQLYKHALVYVNPSLYEGFGLPILEAFAASCPVALSNTSCFREVGGDAAVYFDPYEPSSITEAIQSILFDTAARQTLTNKMPAQLSRFSMSSCMEKTKLVYKKILDKS